MNIARSSLVIVPTGVGVVATGVGVGLLMIMLRTIRLNTGRILLCMLGAFVALSVADRAAAQAPPKIFVDRGACPFEGCVYRRWTVRSDTVLYNRPEGTKPVGRVRKGETVHAIGGQVRVVPTPVTVVFKHGDFHVGDRVYLLTYLGEGWMKVWFKGELYIEEIPFIRSWMPWDNDVWPTCTQPDTQCWGRIEKREPCDWWIRIKTRHGTRGWTKQYDHFEGADLYGG